MLTREEYVKNIKTKLDGLTAGIEKIEHKAESVGENSKAKLQARIKDLREKRDAAFSKIQQIKDTSEETWQDLRLGIENVINSLKDALSKTMAGFKKKKVS
jgi:predicted  nucleic acid-binding Zn-ribbon protein